MLSSNILSALIALGLTNSHKVLCDNLKPVSSTLVAVVDKPATLPCTLKDGMAAFSRWKYSSAKGTEPILVLIGHGQSENLPGFYTNHTQSGRYDLQTNQLKFTDAGTYYCENEKRRIGSVELIILDDQLACTSAMLDNHVTLNCTVKYRGSSSPTIKWKQANFGGEVLQNSNITMMTLGGQVTSLNHFKVKSSMNGMVFSCQANAGLNQHSGSPFDVNNTIPLFHQDLSQNCPALVISTANVSTKMDSGMFEHKRKDNASTVVILAVSLAVSLLLIAAGVVALCAYVIYKKTKGSGEQPAGTSVVSRKDDSFSSKKSISDKSSTVGSNIFKTDKLINRIDSRGSLTSNKNNIQSVFPLGPTTFIGADGTVYVQLKTIIGGQCKRNQPSYSEEKTVYAAIDHTVKVPMVPGRRNNLR